MFFTIVFGDNQEAFVNSNCKVLHLLNYIKKLANLNEKESQIDIDLADFNGEVKNLHENKFNYGSNFLAAKEKYILVKIEHIRSDGKPFYSVLLNDEQIINEEFLTKLNSVKKPIGKGSQLKSQQKQKSSHISPAQNSLRAISSKPRNASTASLVDSDSTTNLKI